MTRRIREAQIAAALVLALALGCKRAHEPAPAPGAVAGAASAEPARTTKAEPTRAEPAAPEAIAAPDVEAMRRAAEQAGLTAPGASPAPAQAPTGTAAAADARAGETARALAATRDVTPPNAPRSLAAEVVSPSKIALTWSPSTDDRRIARYEVIRDGAALGVAPGPAYTDDGLPPHAHHCYAVAAVDGAGHRSALSRTVCAETPDTSPPTAPPNLRAVATGERQVAVSWDPSTDDVGVVAYEVTRAGALVGKLAGRAVTESGLAPAQTYCYTVRAFDGAGNASPPSGPACVTTPDLTPPTRPDAVVAEADGEHAVRVRWEPSADDVGVTAYELVRDGRVVATSGELIAIEKGLKPTVKYCYTVRARDAAGNRSPEGGPACAETPDLTAPSVPRDVVVAVVSDTRLDVRWAPSTDEIGVTGYEVLRERTSIAVTDATRASDAGLWPGHEYCYTVRAHDAAGNVSAASRKVCGKTPDVTPPTAPTHLAATANSPHNLALRWGPATDDVGVARYEIIRGAAVIARIAGDATEYLDTGLTPETEACYSILALDAAGNRSPVEGPACARTAPAGVPAGPMAVTAAPASTTSVVVTWERSPEPDVVYTVYWDRGGRVGSTSRTIYTSIVRKGERRCYQVVAVDAAGRESPRSFEACAAGRGPSRDTASR